MSLDKPVPAMIAALLLVSSVTWIACGSDDPAAPEEKPATCTVRPDTVDFGFVTVGSVVQRTLEIENTGGWTLSGNVAVSTSVPCEGFTIVSGGGTYSLAAGEIHTIIVRLEPATTGEKSCRIETGNSSCGDFVLRGSVQTPTACGIRPTAIDFGKVAVQSERDTSFTITNTGGGQPTGYVSEACDYVSILSGDGSYSLAASESLVVTLRFRPTVSGAFTCTIETGSALCSDVSVTGVTEFPNIVGTAVGETGAILRTADGGETWVRQTSGTTGILVDVVFTDVNTGTVVGQNGTILRTADGGDNWVRQTSGVTDFLAAVSFVDASTGTVVGQNGRILRTTDGGATWTPQDPGPPDQPRPGVPDHLSDVSFVDANAGWVVGTLGVRRTTDGGNTWTPQSVGSERILTAVWFVDSNNGTAVTAGGSWTQQMTPQILRTSDGGATWSPQSPISTGGYNDVFFTSASVGVALGGELRIDQIFRTTNGGSTWTRRDSEVGHLNGIAFVNANIGVAVGFGGVIIQMFDGGVTWVPRTSGTMANLRSVSVVSF
jgi:photosystem II stability/assembly factor-like uncharacterized protein